MTRVEVGARLHFGFQNLSLAHDRLYGGVGVALDRPQFVVEAERAERVDAPPVVESVAQNVVDELGLPGASLSVHDQFDRHVGLGSGTQFTLGCLRAIAGAYGREGDVRARAPALGRGGRSGVGVATFEAGGFVVDAGHPTERFTTTRPADGDWEVPEPIVTRTVPTSWRFLLVTPAVDPGRSGDTEDQSMQSAVKRADPWVADEIATVLTRQLLPGLAERDLAGFGAAVARLGRLNGAWYADEQGGVYRPPAGTLVETLDDSEAIAGAGQSSWGPTVYGVTTEAQRDSATRAATAALERAGVDGGVSVVSPCNHGAVVTDS